MVRLDVLSFPELKEREGFEALVQEYGDEFRSMSPMAPAPNLAAYATLHEEGRLICIAVLDGERLVGVAALYVIKSNHFSLPVVTVDSLYLRKEWRKGTTGLRLLDRISEEARKIGATGVAFSVPPGSSLEKLCQVLGAKPFRMVYWRSV